MSIADLEGNTIHGSVLGTSRVPDESSERHSDRAGPLNAKRPAPSRCRWDDRNRALALSRPCHMFIASFSAPLAGDLEILTQTQILDADVGKSGSPRHVHSNSSVAAGRRCVHSTAAHIDFPDRRCDPPEMRLILIASSMPSIISIARPSSPKTSQNSLPRPQGAIVWHLPQSCQPRDASACSRDALSRWLGHRQADLAAVRPDKSGVSRQ